MLEILAKTKWPMGRTPVNFVWDGPSSPYYLPAAAMRQQAVLWGLNIEANTSHQRLQPLVVSMAILEYERQFMAAVNAAWQAATTGTANPEREEAAAKPDEGQEVAAPDPPPLMGAQPTTGSASTTEQPKEAAAGPIANNQWEVTPPAADRSGQPASRGGVGEASLHSVQHVAGRRYLR